MVAHDFTYPLGHIVTGSFWHNLKESSLHLTIADTGWGKGRVGQALRTMDCRCQRICIRPREVHSRSHTGEDTGLSRHVALCTAHHLPVPHSRRPYEVRPIQPGILHHRRRSLNPAVFETFKKLTGIKLMEGFGQTETTLTVATMPGWNRNPAAWDCPIRNTT